MSLTSNTRKPIQKSAEEKKDFESLVQLGLSKHRKKITEVSSPLQEASK